MTISTLLLVLLIAVAVTGTLYALTLAVRSDGLIGPGRSPAPPRSHPADTFDQAMRRLT